MAIPARLIRDFAVLVKTKKFPTLGSIPGGLEPVVSWRAV
jgi:hypothetical protein